MNLLADEGVVAAALRSHGGEMAGAFTVISPGLVRIRRATRI